MTQSPVLEPLSVSLTADSFAPFPLPLPFLPCSSPRAYVSRPPLSSISLKPGDPFPLVLPLTFFMSLFLLCALVSISLLVYPTPLNDNFRSLAVKPVSGTPSDAETLFYA